MSEDPTRQDVLANVFFFALGIGSVLFVLATVGHIAGLQGRRTAAWCLTLALVVSITGVILAVIARPETAARGESGWMVAGGPRRGLGATVARAPGVSRCETAAILIARARAPLRPKADDCH